MASVAVEFDSEGDDVQSKLFANGVDHRTQVLSGRIDVGGVLDRDLRQLARGGCHQTLLRVKCHYLHVDPGHSGSIRLTVRATRVGA